MPVRFSALFISLFMFALPAIAEQVSTLSRISATIEKFDGHTLVVKTTENTELSVVLASDAKITRSKSTTVADLKPGQFIGCTAVEGPHHKLYAREIHIMPESMRGAGEGHYPWGNTPNTSMTNGNVEQVTGIPNGHIMKVSYKGGQSEIDIPPSARATLIEIIGSDALKPGVKINLFTRKGADGSVTAQFVGIAP